MLLLIIGLLLFTGVHLIPALAPGLRGTWHGRMGEAGYKGTFSLLLLLGIGLIVAGWRSTQPALVYLPPPAIHPVAIGLLVVAFLLLVVSTRKSRLRQWIRHPQLTGVLLWGSAHLLLNGDTRSLLLFGWLTLWALVEIIAINRREGVWIKEAVPGWGTELVTLLITAVVVGVVVFVHPWIAGVPVH
ncbi:MAG: NnrU family protein [Halioglobus sp.]|jgi:uncharacterized membrane protein